MVALACTMRTRVERWSPSRAQCAHKWKGGRPRVHSAVCSWTPREPEEDHECLVMYGQKLIDQDAMPSHHRLDDTLIRRFQSPERIETGVLVKSHKRRKVSIEKKVEECYQWRATQCGRGDSCCSSHGTYRGQKAQSSSPAP